MDAKKFFISVVDQTDGLVKCVTSDKLANSTPCTEWDLRQLCNHVINELLWIPETLAGKTIAEVGDKLDGDLVGDDFTKAWASAKKLATEAVSKTDMKSTVHLSYGDFPAEHYVREVAVDVLVHSWDIGQSVMCSVIMQPDLAQAAYDQISPSIQGYRDAGMVADEIPTDDNADIQTKLLAIVGRKSEVVK